MNEYPRKSRSWKRTQKRGKGIISPLKLEELVEKCLNDFYERRFKALSKLKLKRVLSRKNPYLFRAIGTEQASEIVEEILRAYLSSSDETILGMLISSRLREIYPKFKSPMPRELTYF